jgi:hypothetical protein
VKESSNKDKRHIEDSDENSFLRTATKAKHSRDVTFFMPVWNLLGPKRNRRNRVPGSFPGWRDHRRVVMIPDVSCAWDPAAWCTSNAED